MSSLEMLKLSFSFCKEHDDDKGLRAHMKMRTPFQPTTGNSTHRKKKETYLNFYFQLCVDLRLHSVPCKSGILKVLQGPTLQVGILDS